MSVEIETFAIAKLPLGPHGVLVVRTTERITDHIAERITESVKEALTRVGLANSVFVLDARWGLEILSPQPKPVKLELNPDGFSVAPFGD